MSCFAPDVQQRNIGAETRETLQAQIDLAPAQFAARMNPQYGDLANTRLMLQNANLALFGDRGTSNATRQAQSAFQRAAAPPVAPAAPANPNAQTCGATNGQVRNSIQFGGPYDESGKSMMPAPAQPAVPWADEGPLLLDPGQTPGLLDLQRGIRGADLEDVRVLGPAAQAAMRAANPDAAGILDTMTGQVAQEVASGRQLSPAQERAFNERMNRQRLNTLGAFGPAAAYQDALEYSLYGDQLFNQRLGQGDAIINANQRFYGDPFQTTLGRSSGTMAGGTSFAGANSTAGQFNPFNSYASQLYSQNASAQNAANTMGNAFMNDNVFGPLLGLGTTAAGAGAGALI
jgi:hypothetical protein